MENKKSVVLQGVCAAEGFAYGKVYLRNYVTENMDAITADSSDIEAKLFFDAKLDVRNEIKELIRFSEQIKQTFTIEILETQINILDDPELEKQILEQIHVKKKAASTAINSVFNKFIDVLEDTGSEVFQSRIIDIKDLRRRMLVRVNMTREFEDIALDHILVARDVSPTELMEYIRIGIKGIVLEEGGVSSHTAIVAHAMEIPCIIRVPGIRSLVQQNDLILVDSNHNKVILNPTETDSDDIKRQIIADSERKKNLDNFIDLPHVTMCGQNFSLFANVEFAEELSQLVHHKIMGIGLLRTESQFLMKGHFPDKESQIEFYNRIFSESVGPITVRLFDVGGDKLIGEQIKEPNPFLGWRGIRILLDRTSILRSQLEALLQVHKHHPGRMKIMVPMIMDVGELTVVKKMISQIMSDLQIQEFPLFGTMIEVPSSAVLINEILDEVDFVSIGSNDLTQYVLAVDRGNSRIVDRYEPLHPAVLRVIKQVAKACAEKDKEISICGEMASDVLAAKVLMGLGISELSMVSSSVLRIKQELIATTITECQELATKFVQSKSLQETISLRKLHGRQN